MPLFPNKLLRILLLTCLGPISGLAVPSPNGNWSAVTYTDTRTTGILLSFDKPINTYTCFADYIDLGQQRIAASTVTITGSTNVHVVWSSQGWSFDGIISGNNNFLSGTFTTSGVPTSVTFQRQPWVDDCVQGSYTDANGTLPYRVFVPPGYQASSNYPLVIFLHGGNEGGADNRIQLTGHIGVFHYIFKTNQTLHPCFLAAPQCPFGGAWDDASHRVQVMGMLNKLKSQYSLDTNHIYVTGVSLGGVGSWDQISHYPSVYAAAIPMSGYGDTNFVTAITNIAVWDFHGTNDSIAPVSGDQVMVNGMRRAGGFPIYTEYGAGDHGVWIPAYFTPRLVDWTMSQTRGIPPVGFPLISVTSPTLNTNYTTSSTNLTLSGTTGDTNTAVWLIQALNTRNNALISAIGSNTWSMTGLRLRTNTNNLIVMTAFGTTWMPLWGGNTTFNTVLRVNQVSNAPMTLTISATDQDATLQWTGGNPPYVLQACPDVTSGDWSNIRTTAVTTVTLPLDTNAAFFRISSP